MTQKCWPRQGHGQLCEHFPLVVHGLVAVSHTVCAYVGDPKNFGDAAVPLDLGVWLTLETHLSPPHVTIRMLTHDKN